MPRTRSRVLYIFDRMRAAVAGLIGSTLAACSLLTDLGDLGDASTDATTDVAIDSGADVVRTDGALDAAAPDGCTSPLYTCATAAPSGWTGPFELYDGNPANVPTSCPALASVNVLSGTAGAFDAGIATCFACTSCAVSAAGDIHGYPQNGCLTAASCDGGALTVGTCFDPKSVGCGGSTSLRVDNPKVTCKTTAPAPLVPPIEFTERAFGCAAPKLDQVDCASGQVCVPSASVPFDPRLCIAQAGDVTCPGAPYTTKHTFDTVVNDTRGCTQCGCVVAGGSVYLDISNQPACAADTFPDASIATCISQTLSAQAKVTGSCTLNGAASPNGTVTTSTPFTVCCMP